MAEHNGLLQVWSEPSMVEAGAYEFADTAKFLAAGTNCTRTCLFVCLSVSVCLSVCLSVCVGCMLVCCQDGWFTQCVSFLQQLIGAKSFISHIGNQVST